MFATADALAKLWGIDPGDDERMLGVQLVANGLVNLEMLARAWGKKDPPAPPAGPEDAGG